jgi:hypothetical protein
MRMSLSTVIHLGMICLAACFESSACIAQSSAAQVHPLVSPDAYRHILDAAFSHEEPKAVQLQYSIVLRFLSSKHTESEVVIYVLRDGTAQVMFYRVSGSSVWNIANEYIQKTGGIDVHQIAKLIQTTKQVLPVSSSQATLWYSGLLRSIEQSSIQLQQERTTLGKTGETTIFLDGSTYELWFEQGLTQVRWTVMDEEVDDVSPAGRSSTARWMNEIRRYALNHATK